MHHRVQSTTAPLGEEVTFLLTHFTLVAKTPLIMVPYLASVTKWLIRLKKLIPDRIMVKRDAERLIKARDEVFKVVPKRVRR
jgi:hypothetical protein